jgi:protoporphyrin/coproporphyrin ferrochelatase
MSNGIAVVLCNLGGPDSLAAVRPFLFNLFSDPDIFRLPLGFLTQRPFAALIAWRRAPEATHGYAAIGGKSPILEYTRAQAEALQRVLGDEFDVLVCMRYWHPLSDEVVAALKQKNYRQVILLPLYPQYSITTTGSSYNEFMRQCERQHYHPAVTLVREWYENPDYQNAIVETLRVEAKKFPDPDPARIELLFSAHGLPQKIVNRGDPYERQIRATYDAVRQQLGWPHASLCYQSRVGPLEWLRPYTDDVIRAKAAAGVKQMLVYPIAFVSDHVETLFELGITYADLARARGIAHYRVAPALNSHPRFIQALKTLVHQASLKP